MSRKDEGKEGKNEVFIKVAAKDVPEGADTYVLMRTVDVQRLTQSVIKAKNSMADLHPRLSGLCDTNDQQQQALTQLSEDVHKKLNIGQPVKTEKQPAAGGGARGGGGSKVDGEQKASGGKADAKPDTAQPKARAKKRKVTVGSSAEESTDSDASEMKRDAKRRKDAAEDTDGKGGKELNSSIASDAGDDENGGWSSNDEEAEAKDDDRQIDYSAKPIAMSSKTHRAVHQVAHQKDGKVGVCVLWEIGNKENVKIDEAIQNAAIDKELRSLGMSSMENFWRTNRTAFAEMFEEVVSGTVTGLLRDVAKVHPIVFVENDVKLSMAGLSEEQFIYEQPQPLRSVLIYARKTFFGEFRQEEEERHNVLVRAVAFVKPYLDSIRGGQPVLVLKRDDDDE